MFHMLIRSFLVRFIIFDLMFLFFLSHIFLQYRVRWIFIKILIFKIYLQIIIFTGYVLLYQLISFSISWDNCIPFIRTTDILRRVVMSREIEMWDDTLIIYITFFHKYFRKIKSWINIFIKKINNIIKIKMD